MSLQNTYNKFILKNITIKGIELLPQAIGEFNIYEALEVAYITGNITIADWQGFDTLLDVFGNDDIDISFSTENSTELKMKFKIYQCTNAVEVGKPFQPIRFDFCSPWAIDAVGRQISKPYKQKYIHEIIEDLLKECGATIGYIEPMKQKMDRFTTPLWSPIRSINHLLTYAMNKQGVGGYVIWTDLMTEKVNVTTIDYLFKSSYGTATNKFKYLPENQLYDSLIKSLTVESNYSIINALNNGAYKNVHQGFNFDMKKEYSFSKNVTQVEHQHLATKFPLPTALTSDKYKTITGCYLFPSEDNLITDENLVKDLIDGRAKTKYVNLMADCFKFTILTNSLASRRVGHTADVEFQGEDKSTANMNEHYTGKFLIKKIRHMIYKGTSEQLVTFIADGYMKSKASIVGW
jgi:hypothetical protein